MNIKPLPLEGYIYTPLSNTGEILDNLSAISAWPSYDGTNGFIVPSLSEKQQQQQLEAFGLIADIKQEHQVHPFDAIYTADSPFPFNSTATPIDSSTNSSPPHADYPSNDTFTDFDSCYLNNINDNNDNNNIQGSFDFHNLFDRPAYKHDSNIESTQKNEMELFTTTYTTKSTAALNVNKPSPFSIHLPYLTMSRSSSFTSAVSYIDPALLTKNNNNNNNNNNDNSPFSGYAVESNFSSPQTRCFSTSTDGDLKTEDDSYATMRTMFENSLRMGSPEFKSYSSDQVEPQSPFSPSSVASADSSNVPSQASSLHANPLTSQDIYMADGSIIRFDGASFRPVPSTTTTTTSAMMNNPYISSGLMTMSDPTLSPSPSMMMGSHQHMAVTASADITPAYYGTTSLYPLSYHYHRVPLINDSFKTYNKLPYHRHLPQKSAATTTDSAAFAAALLNPQPTRCHSNDFPYSTGSIACRRSRRLLGNHTRHSSATSFKDLDEHNHKWSSASPSSSPSSPSPLASSLSSFTSESSTSSDSLPKTLPSSSGASKSSSKYRKDKNGQFQCPYAGCDYRYNLKREFNRHRNVHVFAGKDKYRCMNCNSGLCRLDSVKRHMEAKGKAECLKKGLYEEFHESGQYSLIRKCKPTWYEAAAAARAASLKGRLKDKAMA
ncbi:hypothetical protein K457DRAFT_17847 [Linnemannia elongata AG-77]|uniref:C2H2-type domain-containing protein n=1 Tax=Linnemannia elongata AG-77 TaxID=1314771 RepID=A0A197K2T4_9FUNG|nr:hypothetical protein K457DRAFT_17847 [Linnemannia elongata AG-77]